MYKNDRHWHAGLMFEYAGVRVLDYIVADFHVRYSGFSVYGVDWELEGHSAASAFENIPGGCSISVGVYRTSYLYEYPDT